MTEQEHTLKLVAGVLSAVCHMLEEPMQSGQDTRLQLAASDAYENITRTKRKLGRELSAELLSRTTVTPDARTLASDLAEDRH